ncbi:MAG: hypothetical protein EOO92_23850, partial [Pedobacter sp.]
YGIPFNKAGVNLTAPPANNVIITSELDEILTGEMLGDGCITWGDGKRKELSRSAQFTYCTAKVGYLKWLYRLLATHGLEMSGSFNERVTPPTRHSNGLYTLRDTVSHKARTRSYIELRDYRVKWYDNDGVKHPPIDLVITPTVLRHWFIGDE